MYKLETTQPPTVEKTAADVSIRSIVVEVVASELTDSRQTSTLNKESVQSADQTEIVSLYIPTVIIPFFEQQAAI